MLKLKCIQIGVVTILIDFSCCSNGMFSLIAVAHGGNDGQTPKAPCPRLRHAICRTGPRTLLLHGGHDLNQFGAFDDLWSMTITQSAHGIGHSKSHVRHAHTQDHAHGGPDQYHVAWTRLQTTGTNPGRRSKHTLCATPSGDRVVLFGGHEVCVAGVDCNSVAVHGTVTHCCPSARLHLTGLNEDSLILSQSVYLCVFLPGFRLELCHILLCPCT